MALLALVLAATWSAPLAGFDAAGAARQWREDHERAILDEFVELLRLPNPPQDLPALRRNAQAVSAVFERRGVQTRLLESSNAPPVVYGELASPGAKQTITFYAHYDGHPTEPERWYTRGPFRPVLMSTALEAGGQPIPLPNPGWPSDPEWRLYARSAADDKAAIIAMASALEALRLRQVPLQANLKFFIEGENESGSPRLEQLLRAHRQLLESDLWLFVDGALPSSRQQQLVFGARGFMALELTVYGARQELDSGLFSNWSPNPASQLARLLASMRDDTGKVLVEGFYQGVTPLGKAEREAIAQTPGHDSVLRTELGLAETEGGSRTLAEAMNQPALNIRGIAAGAVGSGASSRIPALARASLEVHLVKGMDQRTTAARLIEHIRKQGFYVTETEPGESLRRSYAKICRIEQKPGWNPVRTPMELEVSQRVIAAVEQARGPVLKVPTLGAVPAASAVAGVLEAPVILVPIANHDGNQHAHNENLRLQNLWDGIEVMAVLMALPAPAAPAR
jgi:acetylornithine deacetylase/succinyl-diaminopimelate desuccinylase-like protein